MTVSAFSDVTLAQNKIKNKFKFCNLENPNHEEEVESEHIMDVTHIFIPALTLMVLMTTFQSQTQILPHRFTLVFQDFLPLLPDSLRMLIIYIKHPHLRKYAWKQFLRK